MCDADPIDFDAASRAWRANKKHLGRGVFVYTCAYVHSNGKPCRGTVEAQDRAALYSTMHPDWDVARKGRDPKRWCRRHRRFGAFAEVES
jgi:hypothetical protein